MKKIKKWKTSENVGKRERERGAKQRETMQTQLLCAKWLFMVSVHLRHRLLMLAPEVISLAPARPRRALKCCPPAGHFVAAL